VRSKITSIIDPLQGSRSSGHSILQ